MNKLSKSEIWLIIYFIAVPIIWGALLVIANSVTHRASTELVILVLCWLLVYEARYILGHIQILDDTKRNDLIISGIRVILGLIFVIIMAAIIYRWNIEFELDDIDQIYGLVLVGFGIAMWVLEIVRLIKVRKESDEC